jgi:hypothetical protein
LTKPILSEREYQLLMRAIEFEWTDDEVRQIAESLSTTEERCAEAEQRARIRYEWWPD